MQLHQIKSGYNKKHRRVGRGGKKGTYSGRGMKGQKSRSGSKARPRIGFAGGDTLPFKKIPKKRGYSFLPIIKKPVSVINLGILDKFFENGEKVTPEILVEKKLIRRIDGRIPEVKLLGSGKLTKKLEIEGCKMSESVKKVIGCKPVEVEKKKHVKKGDKLNSDKKKKSTTDKIKSTESKK